jgi:hypothetical protein
MDDRPKAKPDRDRAHQHEHHDEEDRIPNGRSHHRDAAYLRWVAGQRPQVQPFSSIAVHSSILAISSAPEQTTEDISSPWPSICNRSSQPIWCVQTSHTAVSAAPTSIGGANDPGHLRAQEHEARRARPNTVMPEDRRRVTLSKAHSETPAGRELIGLLTELSADGNVTREEMERLRAWLEVDRGVDFPALGFLYEVVEQISEDGDVTEEELDRLALAIERVLPKENRIAAVQKRKETREARRVAQRETRRQG